MDSPEATTKIRLIYPHQIGERVEIYGAVFTQEEADGKHYA